MHVNTRGRASPTSRAIFWWSNYCARDAKRTAKSFDRQDGFASEQTFSSAELLYELEQSVDVPDRTILFSKRAVDTIQHNQKTISGQERQQMQNRPNRSISCERNLYNHNYKKKKSTTVKACLMNLNVVNVLP